MDSPKIESLSPESTGRHSTNPADDTLRDDLEKYLLAKLKTEQILRESRLKAYEGRKIWRNILAILIPAILFVLWYSVHQLIIGIGSGALASLGPSVAVAAIISNGAVTAAVLYAFVRYFYSSRDLGVLKDEHSELSEKESAFPTGLQEVIHRIMS